jgi:hypothetical protein
VKRGLRNNEKGERGILEQVPWRGAWTERRVVFEGTTVFVSATLDAVADGVDSHRCAGLHNVPTRYVDDAFVHLLESLEEATKGTR